MSSEDSNLAMNAIAHAATMAGQVWEQVAREYERPSTVYKPRIFIDGNKWCALLGDNLQEGVTGFGDSPSDAFYAFDKAFWAKLPQGNGA